jgi:hypothetical protein
VFDFLRRTLGISPPTIEGNDTDRLRLLLRNNKFHNPDVGLLNNIAEIDYFVLSIPKCGTTALQLGFERAGHKVIHAHTDQSTFEAFPNGSLLKNASYGMDKFLRLRCQERSKNPVYIFFGYREPVSWYLSMAHHFNIPLDDDLRALTVDRIHCKYPWNKYLISVISDIIGKGVGIYPSQYTFDHKAGFTVISARNVNLVLYRLDRINMLANYIIRYVEKNFILRQERVTSDPRYLAYKQSFAVPRPTLEELFADEYFRRFYNDHEKAELIDKYSS